MDSIVIEVTNGVIVLLTGLILYGVRSIAQWVKSIDSRLSALEKNADIEADKWHVHRDT